MPDLTVVYDANVLYPAPFHARWTDAILDEVFRSLQADRPDLKARDLTRTRRLMCDAVMDCLVTGHEARIPALTLPDPDDRHVLAAAIHCGAQVIVTSNMKDFPRRILEPLAIEAIAPDGFVLSLIESAPDVVLEAVTRQSEGLKKPPTTLPQLLDTLEKNGLRRTVAALRKRPGLEGT